MESNDKRFDELIGQAIAHQKQQEAMNARIMVAVKRTARRAKRRMWLRIIAFALFVPLSIIAFIGCIFLAKNYLEEALGSLAIVPMVLMAIVGIVTEVRLVADFSPLEV